MNRRDFLGAVAAAGAEGSLLPRGWSRTEADGPVLRSEIELVRSSLDGLYQDCHAQLFDRYLPFWEQGGIDEEKGGFMCYLHDDGSIENDRKDIWYQGRGIWVYSYLYNELNPDPKWLEIARKARDFMVTRMHRGDGTWLENVDRVGNPVAPIGKDGSKNIYGALFAAVGLIQFAKATGRAEDLELAKLSLRKSVERYESPDYPGVVAPGIDGAGLRAQGHSFMFVWVIPQLLELDPDPGFEALLREHLNALETKFWNPDFGISNEFLFHDYSRIPSLSEFMVSGHSIEAQWMCMEEALRQGDQELFARFKNRMRRLIEMSWDYTFEGTCDTAFHVFASGEHPAGPALDEKTMWAQSEVSIGCLLTYQLTMEEWAREWFERSWEFLQRTMTTDYGVWRQAVDRKGKDLQRKDVSIYRKGNFHQPRCLMYLMRMLAQMRDKP
jgi:N-acylglucosamine 2-epimerase